MKKLILTSAIVALSGVAFAEDHGKHHGDHKGHDMKATAATAATAATPAGKMTVAATKAVKMGVTGMTCGACAEKVTGEFTKAGYSCNVDLKSNSVTVNLKEGQTITDEQLQTIVKTAGFTPGAVQR